MLLISTLLLRESCRLLVKNFDAMLSRKEDKSVCFYEKKGSLWYNFHILQLLSTLRDGLRSQKFNTLQASGRDSQIMFLSCSILDLVVLLSNEAIIV